jgi:hypothetical protein
VPRSAASSGLPDHGSGTGARQRRDNGRPATAGESGQRSKQSGRRRRDAAGGGKGAPEAGARQAALLAGPGCLPPVKQRAALSPPPSDGGPAPGSRSPSRCWSGARSRCRSSSPSTTASRAGRRQSGCRASPTWARFPTPDAGRPDGTPSVIRPCAGQLQCQAGLQANGCTRGRPDRIWPGHPGKTTPAAA